MAKVVCFKSLVEVDQMSHENQMIGLAESGDLKASTTHLRGRVGFLVP